jgi:calcineurin-like phosphoesterase family protein
MEKDFEVSGKIIVRVSLDVKARTEEEAIQLAIKDFMETYNLNVHGYHHNPMEVDYEELIASEIEWED